MKKQLIFALGLVMSISGFANTKQIPKQFHGCWAGMYMDEITVYSQISSNKIASFGDEGAGHEGKVLNITKRGDTYTVKTKGDSYEFGEVAEKNQAYEYTLKMKGKQLILNTMKYDKVACQ